MEQFNCVMCKQTFNKAWSDEEAEAEVKEVFGPIPLEECDVVCDDCYKKLGFT